MINCNVRSIAAITRGHCHDNLTCRPLIRRSTLRTCTRTLCTCITHLLNSAVLIWTQTFFPSLCWLKYISLPQPCPLPADCLNGLMPSEALLFTDLFVKGVINTWGMWADTEEDGPKRHV